MLDPLTVGFLHRRLQEGAFTIDDFRTITGKSVDDLWAECVAGFEGKP